MAKPKKNRKRLYTKRGRYYADFRDLADVGGRLEALIPEGEKAATTDRHMARKLGKARLEELRAARRRKIDEPGIDLTRLGDFVDHHLVCEAVETDRPKATLAQVEQQLETAVAFFGASARLRSIRTRDIGRYVVELQKKGGGETQRKYLYALSKLFRRARAEEIVPAEHDPIRMLVNKPKREKREREWLEVPEAALLLEAARLYQPRRGDRGISYAHALIGTLLLTGGRPAEVFGLEVTDVNLERGTVTFRPHEHRRLKTDGSARVVRLWPQLREILTGYLTGPNAPTGRLLFPSPLEPSKPYSAPKKLLSELCLRIGRDKAISPKVTRHTYCAARLQTVDNGMPIAVYTVSQELGHGASDMVDEIYGHLGEVRHRSEVVEYRVEQHMLQVKARLEKLHAVSPIRNKHAAENLANRVAPEVEEAVVKMSLAQPAVGCRKVAAALQERGVEVSASGVRWIWVRHDMETAAKRWRKIGGSE